VANGITADDNVVAANLPVRAAGVGSKTTSDVDGGAHKGDVTGKRFVSMSNAAKTLSGPD